MQESWGKQWGKGRRIGYHKLMEREWGVYYGNALHARRRVICRGNLLLVSKRGNLSRNEGKEGGMNQRCMRMGW